MEKTVNKKKGNSENQYRRKLAELKEFYDFSFDNRFKMTPARKAAITKAEKRFQQDIQPVLDSGGTFEKASRYRRRQVKGIAPNAGTTSKGYAIPLPPGADSVRYDPKTKSIVSITDDLTFKTYRLENPVEFAKNPMKIVRKLPNGKNAFQYRLNIGEELNLGNTKLEPDTLNQYMTEELPNMRTPKPEPSKFVFGVTLVFQNDKKKPNKRKRKK
jgi:hypothetical protein